MVHNTHYAQYIPPTALHCVTGTFTDAAGQVAGTICKHRAAANETSVINIPIIIPSNSIALQGAKLESIEIDIENLVAECTSITPTLAKVTRGADTAVAVVSAVTVTYTPAAADIHSVDQHKVVVTLTTPEWVDNDVYYLCVLTIVAGAGGGTNDILGAVANFTLRV